MISREYKGLFKTGRYLLLFFIGIAFTALISSCGSGAGPNGGDNGTGNISIGLTDATTDKYQAVYVTINEVQVQTVGGGWNVIGTPEKTYNLLALVNGIIEQLGTAPLDAGVYTQIRLLLGKVPDDELNILGHYHPFANYIINWADNELELKVPSGFQTGIKLVHQFTVNEGATVELVLDFDACKSIVKAGNSGNWNLKPTIKVIDIEEAYTISGIVSGVTGNPLEGVLVSAQIYDEFTADKKDEVTVMASTITDVNGEYAMLVKPGVYNIMAYQDGYSPEPDCINVIVESGSGGPAPKDFILDTYPTGTVSGSVVITGGATDATATLSFRQELQCENSIDPEAIEIKSILVLNQNAYSGVALPVGTYTLVASSEGEMTQVITSVEVFEGIDIVVNIVFPWL